MFSTDLTKNTVDYLRKWFAKIARLHGDPHYVALGLAIGVFVAMTPTIPFHTVIAVGLCFPLRASKAAAALGVWISNPITIPVFYMVSFKTGALMMGRPELSGPVGWTSLGDLIRLGSDVALPALTGGMILGIFPAAAAYVITRSAIGKYKAHRQAHGPV